MEVHAHSHTAAGPDPSTSSGHRGRKKWTHYFWEFLMLFLAVFCGFLAENLREHRVEHVRAKEFSKSLVHDLQNDTAAIRAHKKTAGIYIAIVDSMLSLSKTRLEGRVAAQFSFYSRFVYWTVPIIWNRATFEQIKNSGSLRYFKNYKLLEKMMKYDVLVNNIESESDNHQIRGNLLLNHINKIIEPAHHQELSRYYLFTLDTMSRNTMENLYPAGPSSLENNRSEIRELLNMIIVQQRNLRLNIEDPWTRCEELAIELINDLKKEYHLK